MEAMFDRQTFFKMNSEEMIDALCDACDRLKLLDVKREDLEQFVFEFQLGKRGINPYEYLMAVNKKRESEFLKKVFDKDLLTNDLIKHEKELWLRAFQTNNVEAKAFQDWYLSSIDDTIQLCKIKGIDPSYDYEKLKRAYFTYKKEYFSTHTIKRIGEKE